MTKVGSIIYDGFGSVDDKKHLATYWRAEEPSNELMAFYYLNKAPKPSRLLKCTYLFSCPGQNFIYADVNNNIAIKQQGNFMLRTYFGDGSFVTPLAQANLQQFKSKNSGRTKLIHFNWKRGFCSSANQNPVDQSYPYLTNGHYENYRNRAINSQATNYTWEDMAKLPKQ